MTYTCPVCGNDQLDEPAARFNICPACGTEFENDDDMFTHAELRQRWIANGAKWWSEYDPIPMNWSPVSQLRNIDYAVTGEDLKFILNRDITTGSLLLRVASKVLAMNDFESDIKLAHISIRGNSINGLQLKDRRDPVSNKQETLHLEHA